MSIADKSILITGTSSGLGNTLARTLLEKGATVIATMRQIRGKNASAAQALITFADAQTGTLHIIEMDVTDDGSVNQATQQALEIVGKLDVVVNNAGIGGGYTEAFTVEQFQQTFEVNVFGIQRVMRAVLPALRKQQSGLIINVSSAMGRMVIPFSGAYTASKFAVEGLSESYRYELHGTGVDVVIVELGGFSTDYWGSMMQPADANRADSYGETSNMPATFWNGVAGMMSSAETANPQGFADEIINLINLPLGDRPLRLVIDPVSGGDAPKAINATTDQIQRQVLPAFGLGDFVNALPESN